MIFMKDSSFKLIAATSVLTFCVMGLARAPFAASAQQNQLARQEQAADPELEAAEAELAGGKYQPAITGFTKLLQAKPNEGRAQKGLITVRLETGQYAEAERDARRFVASPQNELQARMLLGEVYAATGRYAEAIGEFEKAGKSEQEAIKLRAALRRAEMLELTGKQDEAKTIYQALVKFYDDNTVEAAEALVQVARAYAHLEKVQEADDVYQEAGTTDEKYADAFIGAGELYTSKYNYPEAADLLNKALAINPTNARTLLAIASNKRLEGGDEMKAALAQSLKINPNFVDAKVFAATVDIEAERYQSARTLIDEALKVNPNSLDAHSLRAAMHWQQNQTAEFNAEVARVLSINPRYGMLYEVLAHFATQTRRYDETVVFLTKAVELSPHLWSAHLALGQALLRTGEMEKGRAAIETSFKGDPFNIWAKNTLDLLDAMKEYRETKHNDFIVKFAANENDVLMPYATELLDEVYAKLTAKYKFKPRGPISVEVFPNHDDFAVRALGLPGLGALGVCFGKVIAQDSPSARPGGQFNWGSTMWHEFAHVITLQITDHLIPRWFSEGLSVYEEHQARPGWGDDWRAEHIKSFVDGRWFTIANLDNGFIRPKRPDDVELAYFQASQICHFIEEKYGFDAILQMLNGYRERKKTPEILLSALKLSEADFDREFKQYIDGKIGRYVKALEPSWKTEMPAQISMEELTKRATESPDNFVFNLRAGLAQAAADKQEPAIKFLKRSIEIFPYQSGGGNAYEALAEIYGKRGDKAAQAEMLTALLKIDENNYDALKKLGELKLEAGDKAAALELFKLSFYVNPFEHAAHTAAGTLYLERGEKAQAVSEYKIALAASPPNLAEAEFNLANAYFAAGRQKEARRAVLLALESAPSFDRAQELLLKIAGQ